VPSWTAGEAAVPRGDAEAAASAVSDRLVDSAGVAGTPDEVLAKLARYQPYVDWIQVSCGQKRRNRLHRAR
jgi:hypothetical protein